MGSIHVSNFTHPQPDSTQGQEFVCAKQGESTSSMGGMSLVLELLSLRLISFQIKVSIKVIFQYNPYRQEWSVVL